MYYNTCNDKYLAIYARVFVKWWWLYIFQGISIRPITEKGCHPWPIMQTLLMDCLHQGPDQRPEVR